MEAFRPTSAFLIFNSYFSLYSLWASVLAHGFIDTVGVLVGFFGWEG